MTSPSPASKPPKVWLVIGVALAVVVAAVKFWPRHHVGATASSNTTNGPGGARVSGLPGHDKPGVVAVPTTEFVAAIVADFHAPDRVLQALQANAWVKEAIGAPLGRGFLGSWSAFLGTHGSDLGADFKGTVFDLFASQLLASPFRVVWFGGDSAPVTPAVIVDKPSSAAQAAYAQLDKLVQRGVSTAEGCPVKAGAPPEHRKINISRWLVADHPLFAGTLGDRMVFGRTASAALAGLCVKLAQAPPTEGADVEVSFLTAGLGRESELMTTLLGLGPSPRLAFAAEGDHLLPKGIAAELTAGGRLDSAPLPADLLKMVPEDAPVLFAFEVRLPQDLSAKSLKQHFASSTPQEQVLARQAVLLWNPRGSDQPSDTALIWSRAEDADGLGAAFNGTWQTVCGHPVLASQGELLEKIKTTCEGKQPSMAHASPAVVAGLQEPTSITLGVNLGKLLGQLTADAYVAESKKPQVPKEVEDARSLLEQLPFVGLRGVAKGSALVPGGFRS